MMSAAEQTARLLGGTRRLSMMIGAKNFTSDNNGKTLGFRFPGCKKANYVKITLNGLDLYDVEFIRIKRRGSKDPIEQAGEFNNIYNDGLVDVFQSFTGLYLSLGTMSG